MSRKGLFIYNPMSGSQSVPKMLDALLAYGFERGLLLIPFRLYPTEENRDFLDWLLLEPWVEFALVSGGDGTLGTIAQRIIQIRPALPMGIIPSGTCNDFAASLGLPQDERGCIDVVAENHVVSMDVGRASPVGHGDGRLFLSTCAAGVFVDISYSVSSALKKSLGPLAYYVSALGEIPNIRPFPLRVETESQVIEGEFLLFLLTNGSQAAGLANLYPEAIMMDGEMELLLIRHLLPLELPFLVGEVRKINSPKEGIWFERIKARRFRLIGSDAILTTLDGEEGMRLSFDVEVLKCALHVFVSRPVESPISHEFDTDPFW